MHCNFLQNFHLLNFVKDNFTISFCFIYLGFVGLDHLLHVLCVLDVMALLQVPHHDLRRGVAPGNLLAAAWLPANGLQMAKKR